MNPIHFGSSARTLFGMVHPAQAPARRVGVVLVSPMGQEAIQAHRAYRQLAIALARAGLHVLRFDCSGTGDSAGEPEEGSVERWIEDVGTAVDELRDTAGVTRVSLVGLRLGGTLALLAARGRGDVDSVVLWDPVVSGADYLRELRAMHREYLERELAHAPGGHRCRAPGDEALGFPITAALERGLSAIDLTAAPAGRAPGKVALFVSRQAGATCGDRSCAALVEHLSALGGSVVHREITSERWSSDEAMNAAVVPNEILRAIVAELS